MNCPQLITPAEGSSLEHSWDRYLPVVNGRIRLILLSSIDHTNNINIRRMNSRTEASTPPVISKSVEKKAASPTFLGKGWYDFSSRLRPQKDSGALPTNP